MNYNNIPTTLRENTLWCVWKYEEHGKVPYNPNTGNHARTNDTSTFADFETALTAFENGGYDGLGLGIFESIGAIDIDHCIEEGEFSNMAHDIIDRMNSYTEISPSGRGIRIIFTVNGFEYDKERYYINNQKKGLEVYVAGATIKFVTITGERINESPIIDCTEKLTEVLELYMQRELNSGGDYQSAVVAENAKDLLKIGLEKDEKLKSYWNGNRPHGNESEDDAGFMAKLMYWCNNDTDYAIQSFRSSPYAAQKDEKNIKKLNRVDYLPNLAKAMRPDRTAMQDHEQWQKTHMPKTEITEVKGLNIISAPDLQKINLPPTRYLVDGLLPEGATILAAAPKSGKSWFVLLLGLKIAAGEKFLDHETQQAGVLYLSFEDTLKRLQGRMNKLLKQAPAPLWFYFSTDVITLDDGLLAQIEKHIQQHPETKLVIIDTFQKIRGKGEHGERWYEHDYREAGAIKEFMDKKGLSVLFVHHTGKSKDKSDPFNEMMGTNGITGAMDTMLVLKKDTRQEKKATLYITGRDVEQGELLIQLDDFCQWTLLGTADEVAEREKRLKFLSSPVVKTIRALLNESPQKRWTGSAKEILQAGEKLLHLPIATSAQQLSKELKELKEQLYNNEKIVYRVSSNGNAGNRHHFYYEGYDPNN